MMIAMSILVRDERDVIDANIRFHAHHGVDRFIVTDNGSTDGTRDLLETLRHEVDLEIVDEPSPRLQQAHCTTRLGRRLRGHGNTDWVPNNDGREASAEASRHSVRRHAASSGMTSSASRRGRY